MCRSQSRAAGMAARLRSLARAGSPLVACGFLVSCFVAPVRAILPVGWTVHTFDGRIHEIEPRGGRLVCATDGGILFYDPVQRTFEQIADAGCADRNCLTSNQLTSVSRDASGRYWFGTAAAGVVAYEPTAAGNPYRRFFALNNAPGGGLLTDSVTAIEA